MLLNSNVERVVKDAERSEIEAEPERRVAWVKGESVFGLERRVDGGMEMRREVDEQRLTKAVSNNKTTRNILCFTFMSDISFHRILNCAVGGYN
jgi:3-phenylpropionate/cinnamic acid dioxygenase small subunit